MAYFKTHPTADISNPEIGTVVTYTVEAVGTNLEYQWFLANGGGGGNTDSYEEITGEIADTLALTISPLHINFKVVCGVREAGDTTYTLSYGSSIARSAPAYHTEGAFTVNTFTDGSGQEKIGYNHIDWGGNGSYDGAVITLGPSVGNYTIMAISTNIEGSDSDTVFVGIRRPTGDTLSLPFVKRVRITFDEKPFELSRYPGDDGILSFRTASKELADLIRNHTTGDISVDIART